MNHRVHQFTPFRPPVTAIRWGTLAVGMALAGTADLGDRPRIVVGAAVLVTYALWRTLCPVTYRDDIPTAAGVLSEMAVHVLVVVATGYWDSPFVFTLITAIVLTGFAGGFLVAVRLSIVSAVVVAVPFHLALPFFSAAAAAHTAEMAAVLVLVAVVAGYGRQILGEAEARHSVALDRLGRLAEANTLLTSLHRVAQELPASLDLDEVLDSTVARLRELLDLSALAVLLPDETSGRWSVMRQAGVRLPPTLAATELVPAVLDASRRLTTVAVSSITSPDDALSPRSGSGLYAPLVARDGLVGVLALEHDDAAHFTSADVALLDGFTEAAALAIDNARWFSRLRSVGAAEERTRIARELHDRVGQSVAYLAFELDRLVQHAPEEDLRLGIGRLRGDVRQVIGEVRDTLFDLRTDVSEEAGLVEVVERFAERVRSRSGLEVVVTADHHLRLPLLREREMWRVAQEAITNAERHSGATSVAVRWRCDGAEAELEVADNGHGFDAAKAGPLDSYGILGMRERAAGIGATLLVTSTPGEGARVLCTIGALS